MISSYSKAREDDCSEDCGIAEDWVQEASYSLQRIEALSVDEICLI